MMHPDIMRFMARERLATLQAASRRTPKAPRPGAVDTSDVELRLCRVGDDPELERLAALDGKQLAPGRFVVALVRGRIVAALPLGEGALVADPFVATRQLERLLQLRAAQLRQPEPRRGLLPRYVSLMRGSTHA